MTASTDKYYWMQFYHQQQQQQQSLMDGHGHGHDLAPPIEGFSDDHASTVMMMRTTDHTPTDPATTMMASESTMNMMMLSPTSSYTSSSGQLTPKGNASKPIRRRSRASKRTPTTLLNANTTNFRALVQQFTGCPSTTTMPSSSLGVHKGPITLNFQQGNKQIIQHNTTTRIMPSQFGSRSRHHNQVPETFPWQKEQQDHQIPQQQQSGYHVLPNSGNNSSRPTTSMDVSADHGLLVDNDFSLHDLTVNTFSNDTF